MGWREYFEVAKCYLLPAFFAFRPSLTAKARKIRKARKKKESLFSCFSFLSCFRGSKRRGTRKHERYERHEKKRNHLSFVLSWFASFVFSWFKKKRNTKARKIRKARKKFVVRFPLLTVSPAVV